MNCFSCQLPLKLETLILFASTHGINWNSLRSQQEGKMKDASWILSFSPDCVFKRKCVLFSACTAEITCGRGKKSDFSNFRWFHFCNAKPLLFLFALAVSGYDFPKSSTTLHEETQPKLCLCSVPTNAFFVLRFCVFHVVVVVVIIIVLFFPIYLSILSGFSRERAYILESNQASCLKCFIFSCV